MAAPGSAYLGAIRLQAQQRADMVNSNFVSTQEWNGYATNSYKELYDLLMSAYGNDYYVKTPYSITTDGINSQYALPIDFYKVLGVDLVQVNSQSNSNITLKRFNFSERNRFNVPNQMGLYGLSNIQYRIEGDFLWLTPLASAGQNLLLYYVPQPVNLQAYFIGSTTLSSATITVSDTSQLAVGMTVFGTGIPTGATISSIVPSTSITISSVATAATVNQALIAWNDATAINGISGWEEYIITDMAIKAMQKEESDVSVLAAQKLDLRQRINDMASQRDAGSPATVSDSRATGNTWDGYGFGGGY